MKLANSMIWKNRRFLYYLGIGLAAFGMLLVILAVVGAAGRGGAAPMVPLAMRAAGGVGLAALGFASMAIGSHGRPGLAIDMDSSFESDDRHPRFEPDVHEAEDRLAAASGGSSMPAKSATPQDCPGEAVCHWCHAVNDDQARYCDQCGMRF